MTREYIIMPEFERQWKAMGLSDTELKYLQEQLLLNPQQGPVMKGTGGLRKIRVAFEHQGKSGSGRVVYVDFPAYETIYLITPAWVSTSTISPIFAPISALPTGDSLEILPFKLFASVEPTIL